MTDSKTPVMNEKDARNKAERDAVHEARDRKNAEDIKNFERDLDYQLQSFKEFSDDSLEYSDSHTYNLPLPLNGELLTRSLTEEMDWRVTKGWKLEDSKVQKLLRARFADGFEPKNWAPTLELNKTEFDPVAKVQQYLRLVAATFGVRKEAEEKISKDVEALWASRHHERMLWHSVQSYENRTKQIVRSLLHYAPQFSGFASKEGQDLLNALCTHEQLRDTLPEQKKRSVNLLQAELDKLQVDARIDELSHELQSLQPALKKKLANLLDGNDAVRSTMLKAYQSEESKKAKAAIAAAQKANPKAKPSTIVAKAKNSLVTTEETKDAVKEKLRELQEQKMMSSFDIQHDPVNKVFTGTLTQGPAELGKTIGGLPLRKAVAKPKDTKLKGKKGKKRRIQYPDENMTEEESVEMFGDFSEDPTSGGVGQPDLSPERIGEPAKEESMGPTDFTHEDYEEIIDGLDKVAIEGHYIEIKGGGLLKTKSVVEEVEKVELAAMAYFESEKLSHMAAQLRRAVESKQVEDWKITAMKDELRMALEKYDAKYQGGSFYGPKVKVFKAGEPNALAEHPGPIPGRLIGTKIERSNFETSSVRS